MTDAFSLMQKSTLFSQPRRLVNVDDRIEEQQNNYIKFEILDNGIQQRRLESSVSFGELRLLSLTCSVATNNRCSCVAEGLPMGRSGGPTLESTFLVSYSSC